MTVHPPQDTYSVELNEVPFEWQLREGNLKFFGLPAALFWLNPSLLNVFQPLAEEVSLPLFRLLVAHQSSLGTDEDYHAMVSVLGSSFETGFLAWGRAVATAGWGSFSLPVCDMAARRAIVVVDNPWELQMQQGLQTPWGCPFLQGKLIGIFSHAFGVRCWADEHTVKVNGDNLSIEFHIYQTDTTIAIELERLRRERKLAADREREQEIARKTQELQQTEARLRSLLDELSTPLIPLMKDVVIMPLIGTIDTQRAQQVIETLLRGVSQHRARKAIVDITGVSVVDTGVANALIHAAQAVRLLGTEVILTGIRPDVAQTLVGLGIDLRGIVTCGTLQSGIDYAT
jgi:rsbT co-antagonist protein RsbR